MEALGTSRARLVGALLFLAASACDSRVTGRAEIPADTASGEIAFRFAGMGGAALVVPVHINGKGPFDLVLDTGATLTCFDETLAKELSLPPRRGAIGMGAGVGATGRIRLVRADSLRLGGTTVRDLTTCVLDLANLTAFTPGVRGLLGLNVLRNYRVTLDFQRNVLTLAAP